MTLRQRTNSLHEWLLVSEDDPDETQVCARCGAQRNRHGRIRERAQITGGWPNQDCETYEISTVPTPPYKHGWTP